MNDTLHDDGTPGARARVDDPAAAPRDSGRPRGPAVWLERAVLWVVPALCAGMFALVLLLEQGRVPEDVQLIAPSSAVPGETLAVRAFHFVDEGRPEGPRLDVTPLVVSLVAAGRTWVEATLAPSVRDSLEATILVPWDVPDGRAELALRPRGVVDPAPGQRVVLPLDISRRRARPLATSPRLALPLQLYEPGALVAEGSGEIGALDVRVRGGACVPELPCGILVRSDPPGLELALEPRAAYEVVGPARVVAPSGFAAFEVVVHGAEAVAEVRAERGGEPLARRAVRLPVVLGGRALVVRPSVGVAPFAPRAALRADDDRRELIADLLHEGQWVATARVSLAAPPREELPWPFPPLGPGLWRVLLRDDPTSMARAATAFVWVGSPPPGGAPAGATPGPEAGGIDAQAWRALAAAAGAGDPAGAHLVAVAEGRAPTPTPSLAFDFALADDALDVVEQPEAQSGALQAMMGVDARERRVRWYALGVFVLGGLTVVTVVQRRAARARGEAAAILREAGSAAEEVARVGRGASWLVLLVAFAFATGALLIVLRGH